MGKGSTVWTDVDGLTNTCDPPPYPGTHQLIVVTYPPPKICLQVLKNARFGEITFLEKIRESV
jgi:hypothetical protein